MCLHCDSLSGGIVRLKVGPEPTTYHVHETILSRSRFFLTALKKEWQEGKERTIERPDDEADAIYGYIQWLYTGKIACKLPKSRGGDTYIRLASLYTLGEKLLDRAFQDSVVNVFTISTRWSDSEGLHWYPGGKPIEMVYHGTPTDSPMRRLLVDVFVLHGSSKSLSSGHFNHEFLTDFAKTMMDERKEKNDKRFEELDSGVPCSYHHHGKDEPCGIQHMPE